MFSIFVALLSMTAAAGDYEGIKLLPVISNDSYEGRQTTYDISDQFNLSDHARIFDKSTLLGPNEAPSPSSFTVVKAKFESTLPSLPNYALIPVPEEFTTGVVYMVRFVEINMNRPKDAIVSWGISSLDHYTSQWGVKGVFLGSGGNLYADGGLLESRFIENYRPGMLVDWFIEVNPDAIDIFIALNSEGRGHAYHLDLTNQTSCADLLKKLRPVVGFSETSNEAEIAIVNFEPLRIPLAGDSKCRKIGAEILPEVKDPLGIEGKWKLVESSVDVNPGQSGLSREGIRWTTARFHWNPEKNAYSFNVKCGNNLWTTIPLLDAASGRVKGNAVMSTMMGVQPEIAAIDDYLSVLIESLETIQVLSKDHISLKSAVKKPLELVRAIRKENRNPIIINPFCNKT